MARFLLVVFFLLSSNGFAASVMTLNTEFLWDHEEPHEGRIVGRSEEKPVPSEAEYRLEIYYFASLISKAGADIVGLTEIEHCGIAKDIAAEMIHHDPKNKWFSVCKKGRDTFTGQDVAILTRFQPDPSIVDNHDTSYFELNGRRSRPSKVLTTVIKDSAKGESYLVTVAHLISRTRDNDEKRKLQAEAITSTVLSLRQRHPTDQIVIMGDFNDYPQSAPLKEFMKAGVLDHTAGDVCSYTYRNRCQLIDHVLTTIPGGRLESVNLGDDYSDHDAIVYRW